MKTSVKNLFFSALCAVTCELPISCEREKAVSPGAPSRAIEFRSGGNGSLTTRADAISALSSFGVSAFVPDGEALSPAWENVIFSGESVFTGGKMWPSSDPHYSFLASNATMDGTTATIDNSKDYICAYLPDASYMETNTLNFQHVLARIGNVEIRAKGDYTLSNVSVVFTPMVSGTYDFCEGSWDQMESGTQESLSTAGTGVQENDLYLIPGEYAFTATWTARKDDYVKTYSESFTADITAGKITNLIFELGGDAVDGHIFRLDVSLTPWAETSLSFSTSDPLALTLSSSELTLPSSGGSRSLTVSGTQSPISLLFSADGENWSAQQPEGISVTAGNGGSYTVSVSAAQPETVEEGLSWPETAERNRFRGSAEQPVNLALEDIRGQQNRYGISTANCYVVRNPGVYMFPAVYGNAITRGASKPASYAALDASGHSLGHLPNAYGQGISSPYIATDIAAHGKQPGSVSLLWSEADGMVVPESTLRQVNGIPYVVFTVPEGKTAFANALIGLKDNEGTLVWSWHIWCTASPLPEAEMTLARQINGTNPVFLTDNVGQRRGGTLQAADPASWQVRFESGDGKHGQLLVKRECQRSVTSAVGINSVFYQWGRKDPFPTVDSPIYPDGAWPAAENRIQGKQNLEYGITHPAMLIKIGTSSCWFNGYTGADENLKYDMQLWRSGEKTVYDPSPAGYMVPAYDVLADCNSLVTIADGIYRVPRFEGDTEGLVFRGVGVRGYAIFIGNDAYNDMLISDSYFQQNSCWYMSTSTSTTNTEGYYQLRIKNESGTNGKGISGALKAMKIPGLVL